MALMSLSPQDSIIMMDAQGCISFWNQAAEIMFGWTEQEALGKDLHALLVPVRYKPDYERGLAKFFTCGQGKAINRTLALEALHKDSHEFPVELTLGSVRIHDEWFAIGVVRDVNREKKFEFQLLHAEKMESIATMAGGIAHDFNNILASIIGFTELAMDDAQTGSLLHTNLQEVLIAGNRAKDLVRQILKFSRQTDSTHEPVHVKSAVEETLKLIRASFPSTIDILTDLRSEGSVMADPSHIHQIMLNLCTNAEHAMKDQTGVLSIGLFDISEEDLKKQSLKMNIPGPHIKLSVSDTGRGMTTKILSKAFTPFFTTKKQGEGSGMGLPIIHGIVSSLNGWISPWSEPGKGSHITIYLPALASDSVRPAQTHYSHQGGLILFVDDEEPIVKIGSRLLERLGYTVEVATSSVEALDLFKASLFKYRLVITDLTMPHMTGIDLAREMIRLRPDIPIILCTGYDKNQSLKQASGSGIKAVVSKPLLSDEIAETIGRVLTSA